MKFVDILGNGRLWSVIYPEDDLDILTKTFRDWTDLDFLSEFFRNNLSDLSTYFQITDIETAIYDTLNDAYQLRCVILDISPEADLGLLFKHLENTSIEEMVLGREKIKGKYHYHNSWLRLYALKVDQNTYIITGGAIKLTHTMNERAHTQHELVKMEQVRDFLISEGAVDIDGLKEIANNNGAHN